MITLENRKELIAKILIVGESQVGKTSILNRFTDNVFNEHIMPTLGIDYKIKKITVDETEMKLQIWDTAGQERYRAITQNFYKGAMGLILVFDKSDFNSFDRIKNWLSNIKNFTSDNVIKILLGNKIDLPSKVPIEDLEDLLQETKLQYYETSAKTGKNIEEAFQFLAKQIKLEYFLNRGEDNGESIIDGRVSLPKPEKKKEESSCC